MGSNIGQNLQCSLCLALVLCSSANSEVEVLHVKAGSTVTFQSKTPLNKDKQILWTFGAAEPTVRIAKVGPDKVEVPASAPFQSRLHVDKETGDLTLSNLTVNDTGLYQRQLIRSIISTELFSLTVYNPLSTPSISIVKSLLGGCRPLSIECWTENGPNVSLSWFRGNVRLKNTSSLELARLSLTVEVELSQSSAYICEAQNPLEKQSKTFHPNELCLTNGESSSWCHSEVTLRLVLSAIIGLVLIVLVVDHLRIRR